MDPSGSNIREPNHFENTYSQINQSGKHVFQQQIHKVVINLITLYFTNWSNNHIYFQTYFGLGQELVDHWRNKRQSCSVRLQGQIQSQRRNTSRWAIWTAFSPTKFSRALGWIVLVKRILIFLSLREKNMLTKFTRCSHFPRTQRIKSTASAKTNETPVIINRPRNLSKVIGFDVSSVADCLWNHLSSILFSLSLILSFEISLDTIGTNSEPFWNIWNVV